MTKSNDQREAEDYKQQMAEMQARMTKMQKQLDKMRSEQAGIKPKTHLAALPKKSAKEIKKETSPEDVLASANAKQASVLSDSKPTTKAKAKRSTQVKSNKKVNSAQPVKPAGTVKTASKPTTAKSSSKQNVTTTNHLQSATKPSHERPATSSNAKKAIRSTSAAHKATRQAKRTIKPVFPGSNSTDSRHRSTASSNVSSVAQSAVHASRSTVASASVAKPKTSSASVSSMEKRASSSTPLSSASQANANKTAESQGKQIQQMDKSINDLLASVGMDAKDAKDLPQTYFYFISLIDNGKLVDQGRIITFNTKKMNHNGVVQGSDGAYYLDLDYFSKPHDKADALPLPKGYLVDLDVAKTLPDVVTKDPSSTDTMDSNIDLGGNTTIDMPESSKDRGYYIPLSKLNGGKIPVHKVSESSENGSPHQAFVSQQPSQTMGLRHQPSSHASSDPNDIHFDQPDQPKHRSTMQSSSAVNHHTHPQQHHESSRTELRRERNHEHKQKQHVGLGHALGTMFGFGNRH